MNNQVKIFVSVIGILVLGVIGLVLVQKQQGPAAPSPYAVFAQCLQSKGTIFYGAFWCPHCQAQEQQFQMSRAAMEAINLYHECSLPDASGQNQSCNDAKIQSYPTWQFADGSRLTGVQTFADLAAKTGCALPTGVNASASTDTGGASSSTTSSPATTAPAK
jgi:thiol-disulfide isomerase/thioredoxin